MADGVSEQGEEGGFIRHLGQETPREKNRAVRERLGIVRSGIDEFEGGVEALGKLGEIGGEDGVSEGLRLAAELSGDGTAQGRLFFRRERLGEDGQDEEIENRSHVVSMAERGTVE